MNRKATLIALAAGLATLSFTTTAHADTPLAVSATCDAVVISSPETGSTLLGVDAEPPLAVEPGTTLSYPFLQQLDSHHWTVYVIAPGPWTGDPQFLSGDVNECNEPAATVAPATTTAPQVTEPIDEITVFGNYQLAPPEGA